ncbi:unnamed protein product [Linum tenue]|uniref:Bidirectional sugar transporter SWEET n=1 Tax=Linum tenue TaxID=586396 RepID=A0AAV0MNV5_9ROSI|nr:unnamed protein product [Linum tenue]
MALHNHNLALAFGLLGNIVSFFVYLAPLPTFFRIVKMKSTQGFQSLPYSVALFSSTLYLYYASLKKEAFMLVTINSIGCVIESAYLLIFFVYASRSVRIHTAKLLILFNTGALAVIMLSTARFVVHSSHLRINIVGFVCAVFSVCVFAAPLSIIRRVVKTKSVEFMPFSLSLCLTLCAVFWLIYGLAIDDYYIATPNILGFAFGFTQMVLYLKYYKKGRTEVLPADSSTRSSQILSKMRELDVDPVKQQKVASNKKDDVIVTNANVDSVVVVSTEDNTQQVIISVTIAKSAEDEKEERGGGDGEEVGKEGTAAAAAAVVAGSELNV